MYSLENHLNIKVMSVTIIDTEDINMNMIRKFLIKNLKTAFKLKDPQCISTHTHTLK